MIQQSEPFLLYFSLYKKCACNAQITLFQSFFNLQSTVSYDEIKQKVITQANNYHRVKAYTP